MKIETINFKLFKKELAKSYIKDFPKVERCPLKMLEDMYNNGNICFKVLKEDNRICSYAILFTDRKKEYILLWYFATLKEYRKKGYGSKFLNLIKESMENTKVILIEVERRNLGKNNIENEIRKKRIDFYIKNGFKEIGLNVNAYKVEFEILCIFNKDVKISKEELLSIYLKLYYSARKKEIVDKNIYISKL